MPMVARNSMVPIVNICSYLSIPVILLGLILGTMDLAMVGVYLFCGVLAFQVVTLPTETNASRRAIDTLQAMAILDDEEIKGTRKVLNAAAMTYFASVAVTALQLVRLLLLVQGSRRRN